jgi:hypothetical protein
MYAAASKKGGADGVSQSVAKEFVSADKPGKLPEKVEKSPMAEKKGWKKPESFKDEKGPDAKRDGGDKDKKKLSREEKRARMYDRSKKD